MAEIIVLQLDSSSIVVSKKGNVLADVDTVRLYERNAESMLRMFMFSIAVTWVVGNGMIEM
ncbi:MAG: hypothetical protein P8J26_08790 [Pseudomonadales bacterium]|nr:hypothetical protein [Pseudomonadales bacterium]